MGNWLKSGLWSNKPRGNKGELELAPIPPYKKYVALLTQTGTDAPVATVLENTLGGEVIWIYNGVGDYFAYINNKIAFPINKTTILIGNSTYSNIITNAYDDIIAVVVGNLLGNEEDGLLSNVTIEIRVYN